MLELKHDYISVNVKNTRTYGGGQQYSPKTLMEKWGCGVVAVADMLLYLCRHNEDFPENVFDELPEEDTLSVEYYNLLLSKLNSRYLPIIPGSGINGLMLAFGVNMYFLIHRVPYYAVWGVPVRKLWERIDEMLSADIPVIFSIGPNFPLFWQKNRLQLYCKAPTGAMIKAAATCGHYMTVTGTDKDWVTVSSWGRKYTVSKDEYLRFAKKHTTGVLSNILYVAHK